MQKTCVTIFLVFSIFSDLTFKYIIYLQIQNFSMKYLLSSGDAMINVIVVMAFLVLLIINIRSVGKRPKYCFRKFFTSSIWMRIKRIVKNISIKNVRNCPTKLMMFFLCLVFMAFLDRPKFIFRSWLLQIVILSLWLYSWWNKKMYTMNSAKQKTCM